MLIHLLTERKADIYTSGCGLTARSPSELTAWSMDLTCPSCITRLFVTHRRVDNVTLTLDLDNPEVAKKFHFSSKPFGFRWLVNKPVLYVYETPEEPSPALALPIQNFVPEIKERPATYEDAQVTAREWVTHHEHHFSAPKKQKKRVITSPPKPKIPEGYDGPLCVKCGKIDEGDFMPNPENMFEQVCMVCLIKTNK